MSSPQSDKRIDQIFSAVGIADAAKKLHAKSGELEKELAGLGISHKAFPPAAAKPAAAPPAAATPAQDPATEAADQAEDMTDAKTGMTIEEYATIMNQIGGLVMQLVESQGGIMDNQMMLGKSLETIEGKIEANQTSEKAAKGGLEEKIKALELQVGLLTAQSKLAPRSVTLDKGGTPESIKSAVDVAEEARIKGELVNDPFWGELKPLPKG